MNRLKNIFQKFIEFTQCDLTRDAISNEQFVAISSLAEDKGCSLDLVMNTTYITTGLTTWAKPEIGLIVPEGTKQDVIDASKQTARDAMEEVLGKPVSIDTVKQYPPTQKLNTTEYVHTWPL